MKAFEIHTFKDGVWKIDSVFDDRQLALHEASKVDESRRYAAVRVIEENYDEVSDLTTTRTIFRGKKAVEKRRQAPPSPKEKKSVNSGPRGGGGKGRRGSPPPEKKKSNMLVPVLILIIILFAGLSAMLMLQKAA